jgi:hypothetical protein
MAQYRVVAIGGEGSIQKEAMCGATNIYPGMLVALNSSLLAVPQSSVGGAPAYVAIENEIFGKGPTQGNSVGSPVYYQSGDQVLYKILKMGAEFFALLAPNATAVPLNAALESNGDGTLRLSTTGGDTAKVTIGAANGAVTLTARDPGGDGNAITIQTLAASGAGSVAVTGEAIVVTPAAASDTATAVVAQINANALASGLVVAALAAGSSGASSVGVNAATNLAGGANSTGKYIARQAVNNSAGSGYAQIRVEVTA